MLETMVEKKMTTLVWSRIMYGSLQKSETSTPVGFW